MLWLLHLEFRRKDATGLPVLVLCVVLLLRVDIFALMLVRVLVLIDRLRVIELMPHVLILFVAPHRPSATLLSSLLLLAVVVVVLGVVRVGLHGSRSPSVLLSAPTPSVVVRILAVASLILLLPIDITALLVSLVSVR